MLQRKINFFSDVNRLHKRCQIYMRRISFSIKEMAENIRFAIEKEEKLQEEVLLKDKDFVVDFVSAECFLQTFCKMRTRDAFTVKLKR